MPGKYDITDFSDAPIEVLIGNLRKGIESDCSRLLSMARQASASSRGFNLKGWESKISRIREAESATYSIDELKALRKDCNAMSTKLTSLIR